MRTPAFSSRAPALRVRELERGGVAGVADEGTAPPVEPDRGSRLYLVGIAYGPPGGRQIVPCHPCRARRAGRGDNGRLGYALLMGGELGQQIPTIGSDPHTARSPRRTASRRSSAS
jgi:hypothetical protein